MKEINYIDINEIKNAFKREELSENAFINLKKWLTDEIYQDFHEDIYKLLKNEKFYVLNDSFSSIIPFGTGGRRGPIGVGPNRINYRTIGESAQGVANYLVKVKEGNTYPPKAVIAYDTRHYSKEFAEITAEVFAGNHFKVYLFEDVRSTPELSFAVRELQADVGVVISASHNPSTDNGFKVYFSDGGQIVSPDAERIIDEVIKVNKIKQLALLEAKEKNLLTYIGKDIDQKYISAVCQETFERGEDKDIRIVYSPLHGTGTTNVLPVLASLGYQDIILVEEQKEPNGDFPNVKNNIPNPEDPVSMEESKKVAKDSLADLVLVTDPDADRLGVMVPKSFDKQEWETLTGNQISCILTYYVLDQLKKRNKLHKNSFVVKTIVTTQMINSICRSFGVRIKDNIPVGFKFISKIVNMEEKDNFILGVEESHGFVKGTYTRDKDAAIAAALMVELTSILKKQGKTPYQFLLDLYRKYGYYKELINPIVLEGVDGRSEILRIMEDLRNKKTRPERVGGIKVQENRVKDCLEDKILDPELNITEESKNILIFDLSKDGKTRFCVRPSGTEPKIKYYISAYSEVGSEISDTDFANIKKLVDVVAYSIMEDVENRLRFGQQEVFVRKIIDFPGTREELYDEIVRLARQVLFAEAASLFILEKDSKLWLKGASGYWEIKREDICYNLHEKRLTPWIAERSDEIVKIDSNDALKEHPAYKNKWKGGKFDNKVWPEGGQCNSLLGMALKHPNGELLGVLKVENKRPRIRKPSHFTKEDIYFLKFISNIIVLAITKVQTRNGK
ncbi:MAG: GAF domain-containing protein [Candidatus Aminicenantes bacterium]|nr:MAG: GAF domain-containing protein [Candidatus Aminicenantes bacterium]